MLKKAQKKSLQTYKCKCGQDISTMVGCRKSGPRYYCNKCDKDVSYKKYDQLISLIGKS